MKARDHPAFRGGEATVNQPGASFDTPSHRTRRHLPRQLTLHLRPRLPDHCPTWASTATGGKAPIFSALAPPRMAPTQLASWVYNGTAASGRIQPGQDMIASAC